MFEEYDNTEKKYEVIFPDKSVQKYTTQELYEFFIFSDLNISGDFSDLKKKLDAGYAVMGDHMEWDWGGGYNINKGRITITKSWKANSNNISKKENELRCSHKNKYINQAGGIKFWFCRDCKKDLGDA